MKGLILHFDINGTITPYDTTDGGDKIHNANVIITKNVYGKVIDDTWVYSGNKFEKSRHNTSYYAYLKKTYPQHYRDIASKFTFKNQFGWEFGHLVNPLVDSMDSFLFESFLKVFEEFPEAKIVFRTFGLDADEVIIRLKTDTRTSYRFKTVTKGEFKYSDSPTIKLESNEIIDGMDDINNLIINSKSDLVFVENYKYWNDNKRTSTSGKQLLGNDDYVQIFFDDNECVNIINGKNAHFVKVNTLSALRNAQYYVDHIKNIMKNYQF